MAFKGWPATALEFYEGLEADNSKAYWTEHKAVYEQRRERAHGGAAGRPGGRVRRGPDLPALSRRAVQRRQVALQDGDRGARVGAGYVQLSADGLLAGVGHVPPGRPTSWSATGAPWPTTPPGRRSRRPSPACRRPRIDVHGTDALKTAPKGYPKDHPRVELLRNKGLVAMKQWPPAAWLGTPAAKTRIVEVLRAARPLCELARRPCRALDHGTPRR